MNLWRVPRKLCKFHGCQMKVVHYDTGAEYASDFCIYHDDNKCLKCDSGPTFYSKNLCALCNDEPCINSCCFFGLARNLMVDKDYRSWLLIWKRKLPRLPKDLFRFIARYFVVPHRECYGCGPGMWYPVNYLEPRVNLFRCSKHEDIAKGYEMCFHKTILPVNFFVTDFAALYSPIGEIEKSIREHYSTVRPIKSTEVCKNCRKPVELDRAIVAQKFIFCSRKCQMKR